MDSRATLQYNLFPMFMQFTGCHQPVQRFYWPTNAIDWLREVTCVKADFHSVQFSERVEFVIGFF